MSSFPNGNRYNLPSITPHRCFINNEWYSLKFGAVHHRFSAQTGAAEMVNAGVGIILTSLRRSSTGTPTSLLMLLMTMFEIVVFPRSTPAHRYEVSYVWWVKINSASSKKISCLEDQTTGNCACTVKRLRNVCSKMELVLEMVEVGCREQNGLGLLFADNSPLFSATWYWRWWLGFKVISLCWLWFLLRD
jgi:hypothetical protein